MVRKTTVTSGQHVPGQGFALSAGSIRVLGGCSLGHSDVQRLPIRHLHKPKEMVSGFAQLELPESLKSNQATSTVNPHQ